MINDLASNTLSYNGANDAALGDIRPDNAAAIIQSREASLQPIQLLQNSFYNFIEDIAKIWADFWMHLYGERKLRVENEAGTYYVPFHPERYKNLILTVKIDVGSGPIWSLPSNIAILDSLFGAQIIDKVDYLENMPEGVIPNKTKILEKAREQAQAMAMVPTVPEESPETPLPPQPIPNEEIPVEAQGMPMEVMDV
jgi:hypothetical protein